MTKEEIEFLKNKIKEIRSNYKTDTEYKDYLDGIKNKKFETIDYDLESRFRFYYSEHYYKKDILNKMVCVCLKNIYTNEFFNKYFQFSSLMPARESTPPLTYILSKLYELDDYEVYIVNNIVRSQKNPNHRLENILFSNVLYVDIDTVRGSEELDINSKDYNQELLKLFYKNYDVRKFIAPSKIIASGTGLHLYFYLENAFYLQNEKSRADYLRILRSLILAYGGDLNCCDITRILRPPLSYNKKSKFNKPKQVQILEDNETEYNIYKIEQAIKKYNQSIKTNNWIEEIVDNPETLPFYNCPILTFTVPLIKIENKKNNADTILKDTSKKDDYFQIQDYEQNRKFPNNYLIQDLLYYIKNRNGQVKGNRRNLLYIFYFCFKQYCKMTNEQIEEYIYKVNNLFSEKLKIKEIEKYLIYLNDYELYQGITNLKVSKILNFKDEEIKIMRGTYTDNQKERKEIKLKRDREIIKNKYQKKKPNRTFIIETIQNNPTKTNVELAKLINVSTKTIQRVKKELPQIEERDIFNFIA